MVKHTTGQWETRARKLSNTYFIIAKTHQREDGVLAIDDKIVYVIIFAFALVCSTL